ncbi:MAG: ribosome maturation factor RimP [Rickettsiales bacterium]|nr:ribosome maturation factor RimP [Rickettsiales bacterium]
MLEEKIHNLIQKKITQMGYELIRVKYIDNTKTLQIMIDSTQKNTSIGIEDCTQVSHEISVILDVENLIYKRYNLEVSSPGLDRPLLNTADFKKYKGFKAKLILKDMIAGIKKCKGTIIEVNSGNILFQLQNAQNVEIPFSTIESANLTVNEDTLKNK